MSGYYDETSSKYILRLREMQKTLPDFMKEFFRGIADNTTARTRMGYAGDLRVFFTFLRQEVRGFDKDVPDMTLSDLERVTKDDLEEFMSYLELYYKDQGTGVSTYINHDVGKSRKLSALRTLYRYFQKKGKVAVNPVDMMDYPKIREKSIVRLDYNEVAKLLDVVESGDGLTDRQKVFHAYTKLRDLAIVTLMLGTGIRVSECAGVDIDHVDFENGGIKIVRKGGNEAVVYFGDEVEEALNAYLDVREETETQPGHERALFLSMQKKRLDVRTIQNIVKKYARIVTTFKNISPHKLRSTYGTNLYRETEDIYLVADVLGHKSVETTRKHYADMADSNRRKAARAVKLRGD